MVESKRKEMLHYILYGMAGARDSVTYTLQCPVCEERTQGSQFCMILGFEPECSVCGFVGQGQELDVRLEGEDLERLTGIAESHAERLGVELVHPKDEKGVAA